MIAAPLKSSMDTHQTHELIWHCEVTEERCVEFKKPQVRQLDTFGDLVRYQIYCVQSGMYIAALRLSRVSHEFDSPRTTLPSCARNVELVLKIRHANRLFHQHLPTIMHGKHV